MAIPATLTILQPDPGTAIVLLSFFLVLHAEGLPANFLYVILGLFGLFILTLLIGANATYGPLVFYRCLPIPTDVCVS